MDLKDKMMQHYDRHCREGFQGVKLIEELTDICLDHMETSVVWWTDEVNYWRDLAQEAEIDLMLEKEKFDAVPGSNYGARLNIKKRRQFHK